MAESEKRRSGGRPARPRGAGENEAAHRRAGVPPRASAAALLRLAEEIEEHGYALLDHARALRRAAGAGTAGSERREGREPAGGERTRRGRRGGRGEAPEWAPAPKRRRP